MKPTASRIGTIESVGTTQIAIRLHDSLVEFIDEQVAAGVADSRADVVRKALMRYERQLAAERDAWIYATTPDDPDMVAMVKWQSDHMPPLD